MRVLFVTTKTPLPINDGHSLRTYNLLRSVASHHEVTLLSCVKFPIEYNFRSELETICSSVKQFIVPENNSRMSAVTSACLNIFESKPYVARKYDQNALRREIRRLLKEQKYDLVHLDMLPLGVFLDEIRVPIVLNEHNVESALLMRRVESISNPLTGWYFAEQQKRLQLFEERVVSRVNHVLACSDEDKTILNTMAPGQRISVVPNGVDTAFYQSSGKCAEELSRLVFVGGMNWFPNKDAIVWFDQHVLPELIQQEPGIRLHVIGKPDDGLKIVHGKHIVMNGFVDDTRPYLEKASIFIVPIRIGGGTRLKVLEAMSMGKAIVSTTVGVEGIRVEDRRHVLIADTPEEFASCVVELLGNTDLRARLGAAARERACSEYQWDRIGLKLLEAYESIIRDGHE